MNGFIKNPKIEVEVYEDCIILTETTTGFQYISINKSPIQYWQ